MIAVVTHRVSGSVRTFSSLSQIHMARRGSSPKILKGLAHGPLHVITNTMRVIRNGKTFKNLGSSGGLQPQMGACSWPRPWPQRIEPRLHNGHRIARIWTRLIMPSAVPFSRWSTIVSVSSQLANWNKRLWRHGRNYRNRSSTRASVNGIVVCSDCVVLQPADTLNSCSTDM